MSLNEIVGVASRKEVHLYSEDVRTGISFHWIISDGVISGIGRYWKRFDYFYSDSVRLMTPFTTPTFDFHWVVSTLTTWTPMLSL